MKKSLKKISIKDLASLVSKPLKEHGVEAILTGGACVSIYSDNKYQSLDLDFVSYSAEDNQSAIKQAMQELDFSRKPEGFFENRDCPYIIKFIKQLKQKT